jgi:hypothetical protein
MTDLSFLPDSILSSAVSRLFKNGGIDKAPRRIF